jgi:DNA-binding GntR family transcriptional regulator
MEGQISDNGPNLSETRKSAICPMIQRLSEIAPMLADPSTSDSIGEKTYRRIRTDIIFGRLAPGQKLKLDGLKEGYGTSVSTLRELLNRLSSEGLIVAEGLRGFEVTPVSAAEFRELAAMRLLLECHALQQSFAAGDMEWEGRVVSAHHKLTRMEKRMLAGDRSEAETWKRYDREFHHALISACGSTAMLETHAAIYDKYLRYQVIAVVFRGELAAREHEKLTQFALKRDIVAAQKVLATHIQDCVEDTLARGMLT